MFEFRISAPASLSLFGEHTKNILKASIDLRTMLNFQVYPIWPLKKYIEINVPHINLFLRESLENFQEFYNDYVRNKKFNTQMSLFTCSNLDNIQRKILQIIYSLLVYIIHEERIKIKSFSMHLIIDLMPNEKFISRASIKVCIAACLLYWSRLQKGILYTFNDIDLDKICTYAMRCNDTEISKLDMIDIIVCTYGTMVRYEIQQDICKSLHLPRMTILLVDSKQRQDVKARNQRVTELKSMLPDATNSILNNIDVITNKAADLFQKIFDTYRNNELSNEMIKDCLLLQHQALEMCTYLNQKLLRMLDEFYDHLNKICKMAQKHGLSGKYTDSANGRYAYVWCPSYTNPTNITSFIEELHTRGFNVITTDVLCTGVKID